MRHLTKFISGHEYSIRSLFYGDTKIIIPDLQRDYCWGDNAYISINDKKPRELVSDFIKNIVEMFYEDSYKQTTLGLIYGYEQPFNNVQICDGQQRLTTLFLLMGYINIKTKGVFSNYIVSVKEMNDDYEPHLQYAIRESTLYFLSDLSKKVFIENLTEVSNIKTSDWYFNEYDKDASIQSMIAALNTIDKYFNNENLDFEKLGNYILDNLRILYYDMENRSRGEETYVVINTTGEPLSATENIKPLLLGDKNLTNQEIEKYANQWEYREDWFWNNRGDDKTADEGMYHFFTWYWQIGLIQESRWINDERIPLNPRELFFTPPRKIKENANEVKLSIENYNKFKSLENIDKYFNGLLSLVNKILADKDLQNVLLSVKNRKCNFESFESTADIWYWLRNTDLDIVLPLIVYMAEREDKSLINSFARRLRKNHYDGVWAKKVNEITRRGMNYMDWRYLIQIINQTSDKNLLTADVSLLNISLIPNVKMPVWYNNDEQKKEALNKQSLSVNKYEDNKYLMGDLTPLWKTNKGLEVKIEDIKKRFSILNRISNIMDPDKASKDIEFANWFRLYRLVSGIIGFHHIDYCNSSFEGCYYSYDDTTPWWIESNEMENIFQSENQILYMKQYIKDKVRSYIKKPTSHIELVISWITIKTLQADKNKSIINYWDDRAISAFFDIEKNYIIPCNDFHWGNIFCGYSYSYTIFPARDKYNWSIKENLDSPITSLSFIPNFYDRPKDVIDMQTIERGDNEINSLINECL